MKITPNSNRILVKQIVLEQNKTLMGLVLPSTLDREAKTQGKVIAKGDGMSKYKIGQTVAFGTFAGEKLKVWENGKEQEYILLEDSEILCWLQ